MCEKSEEIENIRIDETRLEPMRERKFKVRGEQTRAIKGANVVGSKSCKVSERRDTSVVVILADDAPAVSDLFSNKNDRPREHGQPSKCVSGEDSAKINVCLKRAVENMMRDMMKEFDKIMDNAGQRGTSEQIIRAVSRRSASATVMR